MSGKESSLVDPVTQTDESLREASAPTIILMTKSRTKICTWKIITLNETAETA